MLGLSTLVLNLKKRHRVVGHEKDAVAGLMLVVSPALAYDDGIFNARPDPNANYGTPQQQRIPAPDSFGGGIWAKTILQPTMEDAPAWLTAKPKKKPRMYRR